MLEDILVLIPPTQWLELKDLFKDVKYAPFIYSFVGTAIRWELKKPGQDYIRIYGPSNWKETGTIIAHLQFSCYDFMVFTKQENTDIIYELLTKTKRFDFKTNTCLFYSLHQRFFPIVKRSLEDLQIDIKFANKYDVWWMPREKAIKLKIDIPTDVYIDKIQTKHISGINEVWPHRFPGSEKYLETFLEMGNCYGVFLKSDDTLMAWAFKVHMGTVAILQTKKEFRKKGYGALVMKYMSKEIAEDGHDPLGTVAQDNVASQAMMRKIGFEILDYVHYVVIN